MLRGDRSEVTPKRHVVADEDSKANSESKSHGLVVCVPQAEGEPATIKRRFEVDNPEDLHAVLRDGELFANDPDVAEAERLLQGIHHFDVGNGLVGISGGRARD